MENLERLKKFWKNKNVLITGHTGFKGTWLTIFLQMMGANVYGCALKPQTHPSFFLKVKKELEINSKYLDINNFNKLKNFVKYANPSIVFHLAAQPLVSESYNDPRNTFTTNILGTVNLLDILKDLNSTKSIINVTSDKCYMNDENKIFLRKMINCVAKIPTVIQLL